MVYNSKLFDIPMMLANYIRVYSVQTMKNYFSEFYKKPI